ncbi:MAG: DUF805 domain-containing protein [Robiginitomaculum sp.]|nr:DUF805 domain-containing protein [Robiginitomaculum sp.]
MGNLLFSPNGRIGSSEFMRGAIILIAIAAFLAILPMISYKLGSILGILGLVMIWCWVVLWIKRFRDGGKSGWMSLVPILVFIVASMIVSSVISSMFAGDMANEMADAMENAGEAGDLGAMFKMMGQMGEAAAKKTAIPSAIGGAIVSYAIAYVGNMLIKSTD